jgi:hypothetical protein
MRGFRLTPLIVIIVGTVILVGAGCGIYFGLISPKSADLASQTARYTPNAAYTDPVTGPQMLAQANASLTQATAQKNVVQAQWTYILNTRNPDIDYSDRWNSWLQWATEVNYDFAPRLNSFLKHSKVTPLVTIGAPSFPSDPNAVPIGLLAAPLPTISVFGSYENILNQVESWKHFSRIVMVDGLSLKGYSPFMTGSYAATEYIFTRNSDAPGPPVPSSPSATGAVIPTHAASFDSQPGFNGKAP